MKTLLVSFLVIALSLSSLAGEKKNTFVAKDLGISMEVPISKESDAPINQIAMFFLSVSDGFAANVNVQKQKYSDSIEAYDKLSTNQFKTIKWTVLKRNLQRNEVLYEYKGETQGRKLHWYSRAIKFDKYVYLVTATCLESHWKKQKMELIKSVDSFKIKK